MGVRAMATVRSAIATLWTNSSSSTFPIGKLGHVQQRLYIASPDMAGEQLADLNGL